MANFRLKIAIAAAAVATFKPNNSHTRKDNLMPC